MRTRSICPDSSASLKRGSCNTVVIMRTLLPPLGLCTFTGSAQIRPRVSRFCALAHALGQSADMSNSATCARIEQLTCRRTCQALQLHTCHAADMQHHVAAGPCARMRERKARHLC